MAEKNFGKMKIEENLVLMSKKVLLPGHFYYFQELPRRVTKQSRSNSRGSNRIGSGNSSTADKLTGWLYKLEKAQPYEPR